MTQFVVEEVNNTREYEDKWGPKTGYVLTLVGVPEQVSISQKRDTPPFVVGESYDLELSPHSQEEIERFAPNAGRLKGKKVQQDRGMFGGPRPEDPARSRAIQRMHSQDMALHAVRFELEAAIEKAPADGDELRARLRRWADWFDKDVQKVRDAV